MTVPFPSALTNTLLAAALLTATCEVTAELNYSCEELGQMAERFYNLKNSGHDLDVVLAVIQQSSENNPEKEALLSNAAIDVYIDPSIDNADQARARTVAACSR